MDKKIRLLVLNSVMKHESSWHLDLNKFLSQYFDVYFTNIKLRSACGDLEKILPAAAKTLRILPLLAHYDAVLSMSAANGLFYALLRSIFGKKFFRPYHVMVDVGATRYLKNANRAVKSICRSIFSSVDEIICYSVSSREFWEKEMFMEGKCHFVPLMAGDEYFSSGKAGTGNYLFSAGRYGRDYKTLIEAVTRAQAEAVIVSDEKNYNEIKKYLNGKNNVKYYKEIPLRQYNELLQGAKLVVLPLEKNDYHAGQTVLVQAMASGKAVIASRTNGTADYIRDGEDGMLYEPGNSGELSEKISALLTDDEKRRDIGIKAQKKAQDNFSELSFVKNIHSILNKRFGSTI